MMLNVAAERLAMFHHVCSKTERTFYTQSFHGVPWNEYKTDYLKYYNYITQQKREQIQAMELLNTYIKDLSETGKLTKQNMEDAKSEQEKIMNEVNSIKGNLDNIMDNLNQISSPITI